MASKNRVLGIDIGGSGVKGAPVHAKKGVLLAERFRLPTPQPATPRAVAETVALVAAQFGWTGPVGATVPARVRNGVTETAANIDPAWIGTDAERLLGKALGAPVVVLNDADAAGLAEVTFGAGRGVMGTVLLLTFGTGIGSALFRDGLLVPNTEFGHLRWDGRIAEHFAADSVRKQERLTWDRWARRRVQPVLEHVEFLLAPDLIVVGGGVSKADRWPLYGHLLQTKARLVPAQFGNEAGIIGAAYAARLAAKARKTAPAA